MGLDLDTSEKPVISTAIKRVLQFWDVDRAVGLFVLGRAWSALAVPITLLAVGTFLSGEEQGFYYTFANILALQIFFELGLTNVILQFAAHEKAGLAWAPERILDGDPVSKSRLASLVRMAMRWYGVAAILAVAFILPSGLYFFGTHQAEAGTVAWRIPWIWMSLATAGALFISPIFAVLEGCGMVAEICAMRLCQAIASCLVLWFALSRHMGLIAASLFATTGLCCGILWLVVRYRAFLIDMLSFRGHDARIGWRKEIWPMQWKIALSWLSGYFIFQLFNPILFAFRGPVEAGRMGMSLEVMKGITSVSIAWIYTRMPLFGSLIAKREFASLDKGFFRSARRSVLVGLLIGAAACLGAFALHAGHHPLGQRMLDPLPFALLTLATVLGVVVQAQAVYLRAHKQEPFLIPSLMGGLLVGMSTYFLGRYFGAGGVVFGYLGITLLMLPYNTWIFQTRRRDWHSLGSI